MHSKEIKNQFLPIKHKSLEAHPNNIEDELYKGKFVGRGKKTKWKPSKKNVKIFEGYQLVSSRTGEL
jgi:hypothetical protein